MASNTITTPAGIARYPHLNRPDTKFDDVGAYKVDLEMSAEEAEPFIAQIDELFAPFVAAKKIELKKQALKLADKPWVENDGVIQLKLRVGAMGKNKKTGEEFSRQPKLFGPDNNPLDANIGNGSRIMAAVVPYFWYNGSRGAGVTLQPKAVKVLELVTWGSGGSAVSYGFDVVEAPRASVKTGTDDEEVSW